MITTHRIEVGGGLQLEGLASDVLAVRDHLEVERAHLVGNSPGGLIGFEIAATVPDRLITLTTFGTKGAGREQARATSPPPVSREQRDGHENRSCDAFDR